MEDGGSRAAMTGLRQARARLHVCSMPALPDLLVQIRATHLVTVVNEQLIPATPEGIPAANHLRLACNDIVEAQPGLVCPSADHIDALIAFARAWGRAGPMVVHCWAGISRSTAAAFIVQCALNPAVPERHIAGLLRKVSPSANPNQLMVRLGDAALGRQGRMIAAVASIGQGEPAMEGRPFALDSLLD